MSVMAVERLQRVPLRPVLIGALALFVLAVLGAGAHYVLDPTRYPVLRVRFSGPFQHVTREQLAAVVGDSVQGNFFRLDLNAVRARVESLPWVYHAIVRRQWPWTVEVAFTEQRFVAQWGPSAWLNGDATAVTLPAGDVPHGLPMLQGPDGTQAQVLNELTRFSATLAPLGLRVAMLALSPRRTWSLRLDNGLTLRLGREQPGARLARFAGVYAQTVADKVQRIRQVDLRYSNGFSVEWRSAS